MYRGREYDVSLLPKTMIEMAVSDDLVDDVIAVVMKTARTGDIGDGRIWVLPIEEGYNIRTARDKGHVAITSRPTSAFPVTPESIPWRTRGRAAEASARGAP